MNHTEFLAKSADTDARDALTNARDTLQRAINDLEHYIGRYEQADTLNAKADVMNWTLSYLATYIPSNVRLDMIARAQAGLAVAAMAQKSKSAND